MWSATIGNSDIQPTTGLNEQSLTLFALLGGGGLLAHLLTEALDRHLTIRPGATWIGLGWLAGIGGSAALPAAWAATLGPVTQIVLGWVALQIGLAASLRRSGPLVEGAARAGVLYAAVSVLGLGLAAWLCAGPLLALEPGVTPGVLWVTAVVTAAALSVAAPWALATVSARLSAAGPVADSGASLARVSRVTGLLTFGLAAVFLVADVTSTLRPVELIVGEIGAGLLFGVAADAFIGTERDARQVLVTMLVSSLLATGTALHVGFSPVAINLIMGLSVANFGHQELTAGGDASTTVPVDARLDLPARAVLLFLAGAAWTVPDEPMVWLAVAGLLLSRLVMLRLAGAIAGRALDPTDPGLRLVGLTLVGQGCGALVIALAFLQVAPASAGQLLLTTVLLSIALSDLTASRAARMVLDEAGEIPTHPLEPAPANTGGV